MGNYKKRGAAALAPLTAAAGHSGPMSVVAAGWDRTKTAKQNMSAIGLTSDPNADSRHRLSKVAVDKSAEDKALTAKVHKQLEDIVESHVPTVRFAAAGEIVFVKKLVLKHGTNYKAMARDHKINVYQHTPAILKRKVEKVMGTLDLADEHGIEHE